MPTCGRIGRVRYESATDEQALAAFVTLSRSEGIVPALRPHTLGLRAGCCGHDDRGARFVVNLSGRGDKDLTIVTNALGMDHSVGSQS